MIKNITSVSEFLTVTPDGGLPYLSSNIANPLHGMIRLKDSNFEVFDGNSNHWQVLYGTNVRLAPSPLTQDVLTWAQKRMQAEAQAERLAATNPTVADALETYSKAHQQLTMIMALTATNEVSNN